MDERWTTLAESHRLKTISLRTRDYEELLKMLINVRHNILDMPIVRLKTKEQKVKELFDMFKLPTVDYTKGYQAKPRPELTGGSVSSTEASGLHAVKEIRRWYRRGIV